MQVFVNLGESGRAGIAARNKLALGIMPQIVYADIIETGRLAHAPPRLLQVDEVLAGFLPDDDVRVVIYARQIGQNP